MRAVIVAAALGLPGCAALVQDDWNEAPTHPPLPWRHFELPASDLARTCRIAANFRVYGCAYRVVDARICIIYTGPSPAAWVMEHERKHCAGWDHGPGPGGTHVAAAHPQTPTEDFRWTR
jgi:hypothetical protein